MWKQYMQPTKSTKAKTKEPENVRERIQSLSQALSGLKEEVKIETSATAQNLERLEKQQLGSINSQVFALKKALSELADAMIEEVEGVRNDYRGELAEIKEEFQEKMENLSRAQQTVAENTNKVSSSLTISVKQAFQHIQNIKNSQDDMENQLNHMKNSVSNLSDGQKDFAVYFDKVFKENCEQLLKVSEDFKEISLKVRELEIMPKQLNYIIEKEKEKSKLVEEKVEKNLIDFDTKIRIFYKEFENIGNRKEILELKNFFTDFQYKTEVTVGEFKKEMLDIAFNTEKKWEEFNKIQENFNQFVCGELKNIENISGLSKRIEFLEDLSTTQRRELFNSLSSIEQNFYKKQEKIIKALYQLARGQDMPEAMLMI